MKVVFGSVVYNQAKKYLPEFFISIEKMINKEFSVTLINDDINPFELEEMISSYSIQVKVSKMENKTPIQLRIELLRRAKLEETDLLILGDCDDTFSNTRIGNTIQTYINYPGAAFFYNQLINNCNIELMPIFPEHIYSFKEIGQYNFLGLSNTALNMKKISIGFINSLEEFCYEIFDWYLFSRLLLEGMFGKKVKECYTIYRLHENNIVGIQEFNGDNIKHEIEVKQKHYESLKKYDSYYKIKYEQYKNQKEYQYLEKEKKYFWWNLITVSNEKV